MGRPGDTILPRHRSTADEAAAAIEAVAADPARHQRTARAIACDLFHVRVVLGDLLARIGAGSS